METQIVGPNFPAFLLVVEGPLKGRWLAVYSIRSEWEKVTIYRTYEIIKILTTYSAAQVL